MSVNLIRGNIFATFMPDTIHLTCIEKPNLIATETISIHSDIIFSQLLRTATSLPMVGSVNSSKWGRVIPFSL